MPFSYELFAAKIKLYRILVTKQVTVDAILSWTLTKFRKFKLNWYHEAFSWCMVEQTNMAEHFCNSIIMFKIYKAPCHKKTNFFHLSYTKFLFTIIKIVIMKLATFVPGYYMLFLKYLYYKGIENNRYSLKTLLLGSG